MLMERLEPEAADVFERARSSASARWGEGAIDDLVLLQGLLEVADDDLLKVFGSHLRRVLAALRDEPADAPDRRVPYGEHLLEAAYNEALDLGARRDEIGGLHLVLALFFFPGCRAAGVLQACGIDWRPLHSLARRLTGTSYFDW